MRLREILASNLRQLRDLKGLSQESLADLAEIDRSYISYLENQRYSASLDMLEKLAIALGVEPQELITARPSM